MATISKYKYDALQTMSRIQEFWETSHVWGVSKGKWSIETGGMGSEELIRVVEKAVPSVRIDSFDHAGSVIPGCPFGPHRLYNLAVKELIRRYRVYGREWMKVDAVEATPPEVSV